jgi:hypothetical protein
MEWWTALDTIWLPNVVFAASPNRKSDLGHPDTYEVVVMALREMMV